MSSAKAVRPSSPMTLDIDQQNTHKLDMSSTKAAKRRVQMTLDIE